MPGFQWQRVLKDGCCNRKRVPTNGGTTEQGVNGWTKTKVGDNQVGLQYGLAGSGIVDNNNNI